MSETDLAVSFWYVYGEKSKDLVPNLPPKNIFDHALKKAVEESSDYLRENKICFDFGKDTHTGELSINPDVYNIGEQYGFIKNEKFLIKGKRTEEGVEKLSNQSRKCFEDLVSKVINYVPIVKEELNRHYKEIFEI